jgi:hypothetical protein
LKIRLIYRQLNKNPETVRLGRKKHPQGERVASRLKAKD